jgi:hypothetical protein
MLWLAGFAMCGHLVIIHDHHIDGTGIRDEGACPATSEHSGHNHGFPMHCHAFNDIASEKAAATHVMPKVPCSNLVLIVPADPDCLETAFAAEVVPDLRIPFFDSSPRDHSSLRAPPSRS